MLKKLSHIIAFLLICFQSVAQENAWQEKPTITLSGFVDIFYVYDFNEPEGSQRQAFLFNHNRHNEFNMNLGLLKFNVENSKYRANLALQTGTYAIDNYAAEPDLLRNIFEANVGVSLTASNRLWLDAGILTSHIGFESAISSENWTLTRSLLAENSPYFLTGAKLTYLPSEKWEIAGLLVNGWQRIQRLEGNSMPSLGTQVTFSPNDKVNLNWTTFVGTDTPDSTRRMRYFSNLYGKFQLSEKIGIIAGFDVGFQQKNKGSSDYDRWLSPIIITQFALHENWKMALRAEYYEDENGVTIPTNTPNGFQTTAFSLNFDYLPSPNIICRLEGRWLSSKDALFERNDTFINNNFIIATSIAINFSEKI